MSQFDSLFDDIRKLVMHHSPSGMEAEVDGILTRRFTEIGLQPELDAAGNLLVRIPGQGHGRLAITAHKDEIGCIVTELQDGGRIKVRKLGGSHPWVYGEGAVDLLGDVRCVMGVLSFGSRHVSHASPQSAFKDKAPLLWADAWIETKLTEHELREAGVRVGTRAVIGRHRKSPIRLKDYIASYTLDNKASLVILLELAKRLKKPRPEITLVASSKEEVGALGALYFTQREAFDALIALEIAPVAPEYKIQEGPAPVLMSQDGRGLYDETLNLAIRGAAERRGIPLQLAVISGFGSDGSHIMNHGHVPKAACLAFPTQNTHGFEIAHMQAITNCIDVMEEFCLQGWGASKI